MKSPAGQPRARRPAQKRPVQLNLQRTPTWPEDGNGLDEPQGNFWKWFFVVLLVHVAAFALLLFIFRVRSTPPPPQFISLLPAGDVARGTPGPQAAAKVSPTTPAPQQAASAPPPPPTAQPEPPKPVVHPLTPVVPKAPPVIIKENAEVAVPPVKPEPKPMHGAKVEKPLPAKPRIKIDLSKLVDAPDTEQTAPTPAKPTIHPHKIVHPAQPKPDATDETDSQTSGLSREEVAAKLGNKLKAEGVEQGHFSGPNGSTLHSKSSDFSEFYQSIHDQVMSKWTVPNSVDETAIDPIVRIHVAKDGQVPADRVTLERSSNNPVFDQSALEAARGMGATLQPLPDGCPPDISITFNLRQQ